MSRDVNVSAPRGTKVDAGVKTVISFGRNSAGELLQGMACRQSWPSERAA
jgi:hypothetical protein